MHSTAVRHGFSPSPWRIFFRIAMCRLWPDDGQAVAAGDQEQALADRRRAVIAGSQLAPFDAVTVAFQLLDPEIERLAFARGAGISFRCERSPILKLLDILQADDARPHRARPADDHPRQPADMLQARLAALGLAVVRAVGREPGQGDPPAGADLYGIHGEDVFAVMAGQRVVGRLHSQGLGIVVDGNVDRAAERHFYAGRCTAAPGEVVDDQVIVEGDLVGHGWSPVLADCSTGATAARAVSTTS
jgi:hypothetical protein